MEIEVLTDKAEIAKAQKVLEASVKRWARKSADMVLGFQGGSNPATVFECPEVGIWAAFEPIKNRYWNAFGLGQATESKYATSIVIEVNPPYDGIDRRVQGAFGKTSDEKLVLLHRGKPGGGRLGVGKKGFLEYYSLVGPLREVNDGNRTSEVIVVAALGDHTSASQIANFVEHVAEFKRDPKGSDRKVILPPRNDNDEFEGVKKIPPRAQSEVEYRHGPIVNELKRQLQRCGFETGHDPFRDLIVYSKRGREIGLFEVKPGVDWYSLYQAVGQLLIHGRAGQGVRFAVLPEEARTKYDGHLKDLGLGRLYFKWEGPRPAFLGLDAVVEELARKNTA